MTLPASPLQITLTLPLAAARAEESYLRLGDFQPAQHRLNVNSRWIERDGRPWVPVMGEFHYSRFPEAEWEVELRKMAAGGVDIVASYVFWNHHEEIEGRFDWEGRRSLRRFVALVQQVGMYFYLRPGPWVHAEARLGGFPDWLPQGGPVRCNDARYLQHVQRFYGEIGVQLKGLMWCDGGPVIGVQLENEYDQVGPGRGAEHVIRLKQLAIEAGLTVPLYTVTGWPTLDIPAREVIPVSGAYADGFWSGAAGSLPASGVFLFDTSRAIGEMGNVGGTPATEQIDKAHYPFFLAEAGGGMHVSYHRRPVVSADDVAATALVQIGSGANLYGYYMYHGGANPQALVAGATLNETQASGYPNDVPQIGYDFRAPLGQYGQQRESYGRLRCLHQFLAAFGAELAPMEAVLRDDPPSGPADASRLRVSARGDGKQAFLFVNNHVRHHPLPAFDGVQFRLDTGGALATVPHQPVTVPTDAYFIWPAGLRIGAARLHHATVQPLTRWKEGEREVLVAFAHPGIAPTLCFDAAGVRALNAPAEQLTTLDDGRLLLTPPLGDTPLVFAVTDALGVEHHIVLLPRALAEQALHTRVNGRERLLISPYLRYVQDDVLVLSVPHDAASAQVQVFPCDDLAGGGGASEFMGIDAGLKSMSFPSIATEQLRESAQVPAPQMGPHIAWRQRAVPMAPADAFYDTAARVRLTIPTKVPSDQGRVLLAIDYIGDAARLYADGVLVDDHFYDGETWWVGVDRFAREGRWPKLEVAILAADPEAPIFMEEPARLRLRDAPARACLTGVALQWWRSRRVTLTPLAP